MRSIDEIINTDIRTIELSENIKVENPSEIKRIIEPVYNILYKDSRSLAFLILATLIRINYKSSDYLEDYARSLNMAIDTYRTDKNKGKILLNALSESNDLESFLKYLSILKEITDNYRSPNEKALLISKIYNNSDVYRKKVINILEKYKNQKGFTKILKFLDYFFKKYTLLKNTSEEPYIMNLVLILGPSVYELYDYVKKMKDIYTDEKKINEILNKIFEKGPECIDYLEKEIKNQENLCLKETKTKYYGVPIFDKYII